MLLSLDYQNALLHLDALRVLNIYNTEIQDWNVEVMRHIGSTVQTLYLTNVGFSEWPGWISYFSNLTELTIVDGTISTMPDDALDNVANSLSTISLMNNRFTSISKAISILNALQTLIISNNNISDLTWLPKSSKLFSLSLDNNQLSDVNHVSLALRPFAESLMGIGIVGNKLPAIPDMSYLTRVATLDLSSNRISDPTLGSLANGLSYLDLKMNYLPAIPVIFFSLQSVTDMVLGSNVISEIRGSQFPPWTEGVDLGYNLITELTDTSFPENCSILSLNLISNPVTSISTFAFKNLQRLTVLNLSYSKLTRLPLALSMLTSLTFFDIDRSDDLICTCEEKILAPWIMGLPDRLSTKCGQVSISDFFATLSQDCPDNRVLNRQQKTLMMFSMA